MMTIEILFENENLIIINKPSGLVVHSDGKTDEPTVVDWILQQYPQINGVGENMLVKNNDGVEVVLNRPGIVHRIDRDTSGCLVIAKTQTSFEHLKQQFKDRLVKKTYHAIVYGHPKDSGIIDAPIGRSSRDFRMKQAGPHARGHVRNACTEYRVLTYFQDMRKKDPQGQYEKYALVACYPKTGRTHQIRVHLKYIHHPIVADSLYRGKRKQVLGLSRTALHAYGIEFFDRDNALISVSVEVPHDISESLQLLHRCE